MISMEKESTFRIIKENPEKAQRHTAMLLLYKFMKNEDICQKTIITKTDTFKKSESVINTGEIIQNRNAYKNTFIETNNPEVDIKQIAQKINELRKKPLSHYVFYREDNFKVKKAL